MDQGTNPAISPPLSRAGLWQNIHKAVACCCSSSVAELYDSHSLLSSVDNPLCVPGEIITSETTKDNYLKQDSDTYGCFPSSVFF